MFSKNELISVSSTNYIERNVTKHMTNVHIWAFLVRKCKDPPFPGNCSNVKEMQPPLMPFCGYPYYLLLLRCFGILGCLLNTWFFFFFFFPSAFCSPRKVNSATLTGARQRVFPFQEHSLVNCFLKEAYLSFCLVSFWGSTFAASFDLIPAIHED